MNSPGQVAFLCPLASWSEKQHLRSTNPIYYIRNWYCYIISIVPRYDFRICLNVYACWSCFSCNKVFLKFYFEIIFKRGVVSTWSLTASRNSFLPMPGSWFHASLFSGISLQSVLPPYMYIWSLSAGHEIAFAVFIKDGSTWAKPLFKLIFLFVFFGKERNLILPFSWANLCHLMLLIPRII